MAPATGITGTCAFRLQGGEDSSSSTTFRRAPFGVSASSPHISWALDAGPRDGLPVMANRRHAGEGGHFLAVDVKCYGNVYQSRHGHPTFQSASLYQLFAYVKNIVQAKETSARVSGLLLYAATGERVEPSSCQMSGKRIGMATLDLNRPFSEIRAQLDGIASEHFAGDV